MDFRRHPDSLGVLKLSDAPYSVGYATIITHMIATRLDEHILETPCGKVNNGIRKI